MDYATLVSDLQTWPENFGAEYIAAIPEIVRKAEDRIFHAVQLPSWRQHTTVSAAGGLVSLPADFISLSSIAVTGGNFLLCKDITFIGEVFGTTPGVPRVYALYDQGRLLVGPAPAGTTSYTLHYFAKPASIVDAGTSWLGDHAESVLFYACLSEAYVYMKGDQELQARYQALRDEGLAQLKALGEGKLKTDDFKLDRSRS